MATTGTTTIDFTTGTQRAVVTVANGAVGAGSYIEAWMMSDTSADHSDYEHQMASMVVTFCCGNIVAGVSFDAVAVSLVELKGIWTFRYVFT